MTSHEAAKASPPKASIPSALDKLRALQTMCAACGQPFYVEIIDEVLAGLTEETALHQGLISEESIEALAADIACAVISPLPDAVALRHSAMVRLGERLRSPLPNDLRRAASAIEAGTAATGNTDAVHESAAPNGGDAQ